MQASRRSCNGRPPEDPHPNPLPQGEGTGRTIREVQDMSLLEVENLRTYFKTEAGEARAVDGVSLTLEEGESLALVGESACGKPVTALSIMRLIEPPSGYHPSGSIRFAGTDLLQAD